jgi:hypothetical protein
VQLLGQVSDLGVIRRICSTLVVDVLHTDPDLSEELFEGGDESVVRRLGLLIGVGLVVVRAMIQIHAEHTLVGVAPGRLDVSPHVARSGGNEERRRISVQQFLGGPQPSLTFRRLENAWLSRHRPRHAQFLTVQELANHTAKDLVDTGVFDHVGIDQVVP